MCAGGTNSAVLSTHFNVWISILLVSRDKTAQGLVGQSTQVSTLCKTCYHHTVHVVVFSHAPSVPTPCFSDWNWSQKLSVQRLGLVKHNAICSEVSCKLLSSLVSKKLPEPFSSFRPHTHTILSPTTICSRVWVVPMKSKELLDTLFSDHPSESQFVHAEQT